MGEVFTIERGGSPRPIEDFITSSEEGINWIKIGDTKDVVKYIYRTKEKIKPEGAKRSRMVFEDDFLLSNSMSFGRPFIMKTTGCIHDGWLVIRKNETIDNNYLYYILSSNLLYQQFSNLAKGSTVKNLNIEAVKQAIITFPSLPEQHAIVSKIEELLSELDKGKQQLEIAQQQLKIYRQAVLKWAFEGKLSASEFSGLQNEQNGNAAKSNSVKSSNSVNSASDNLPKGWKWVKVLEIGEVYTGSTPAKSNASFYGNDFPFYKPSDLEAGYNVRLAQDNLSKSGLNEARFLPENSILVTCIGATIGKTGIIRRAGASNQQINAIIPSKKFNPNFIYYQAIAPNFQEQIKDNAAATTLPILNKSKFQNLRMVDCPIEVQNSIVQQIESRLSVCDKVEETITTSLAQAETLRQSILKKAFEGKLISNSI